MWPRHCLHLLILCHHHSLRHQVMSASHLLNSYSAIKSDCPLPCRGPLVHLAAHGRTIYHWGYFYLTWYQWVASTYGTSIALVKGLSICCTAVPHYADSPMLSAKCVVFYSIIQRGTARHFLATSFFPPIAWPSPSIIPASLDTTWSLLALSVPC